MSSPVPGEESIFAAVMELPRPEERARYLQEACGGDVELRQRVEALLRFAEHTEDFLERPPLSAGAPSSAASSPGPEVRADKGVSEQPGDRIGPYKLLECIGEGGCGVVYMAEQAEPIRRRVALKVIKLGMDTRDVIARFEAERQALALMDHPNIAKVLDAGATGTGRPYFVMELVRGIQITDYCDQSHLSTRARLDLFVKVCQAIQHAHQKGIIHRDIKPSNILVTLHDGEPVPKVIDFGIAKATGQQRLTDKTVFTAFRQFLGTPAYMSPEQAEMTGLDIDTRSDIYSLGVLLYELLIGRTPFDVKELLAAGLDEMRRTIREQEPLRPSTRLSTLLDEERTIAASRRQIDPIELIHLLRGDLDWIAMKCLEKDRTRRYPTANGLAVDIQRHLNNEPVAARPPSRRYLLQKLVLRNKGTVAALSAVAAALIAGLVTSTFLYLDKAKAQRAASRETDHARSAEADALEKLRGSYLAQAQAGRWSQRVGRRFAGLELLEKAAAIRPAPDLGNEAIACMALTDLRVIKEWNAYPLGATFVSFDRNYERCVYGDAQGTVHIRRIRDETEVVRLEGYEPPFQSLEFSRDGKLLFVASGRQRNRLEVWNLEPRALLLGLDQPMFRAMDFSADSRLVAIASEQSNNPVRIYSLAEHREVASFDHGSLPYYLAFHPKDSHWLLTSDESPVVRLWDCETRRLVRSFQHPGWVQGINWHPAGDLLATACADGIVRLWEAASGTELAQLARHQAEAVNVSFSQDGTLLASRGWDGRIELWNLASRHEVVEMGVPGFLYPFSRRDNQFGVGLQPGRLALLEAASGIGYRLLGADLVHAEKTLSCSFSADGRWMVSTHENKVRCWDLLSGKPIAELPKDPWEHFAVLHPDGKRLFIGTRQGVEEWSLTPSSPPELRLGRKELCHVARRAYIMTLSRDGRRLAVSAEAELQIIDTESGRQTATLKPPYSSVFGALSSDGQLAVTWGCGSTNVQIWDALRSAVTQELPSYLCNHAAFSPNNRWLVIGNVTEFRVWDVATWQSRFALPTEAAGFYGYSAFSPDSQMLAAAISRTAVRLVETASGRELATLEAPEQLVISWIAFNADGTQLAVALATGPIQLWDLRLIRQQLASMNLDWEMPPYPRKKSD